MGGFHAAMGRMRACRYEAGRWRDSETHKESVMKWLAWCAAVMTALAVWLWLRRHETLGQSRLSDLHGCVDGGAEPKDQTPAGQSPQADGREGSVVGEPTGNAVASAPLPHMASVACVAALQASVRSGATLVQAFEELGGCAFATPELTRSRIEMVLRCRCPPEEQGEQMRRLSAELYAACQLSMALGCETSRCLAAVLASLKRQRLLNDLRRNAFAMPQATVKLLMALPLLTVLLGEGMGARPLAFLCGDARGLLCLGFALGCYAIGLLWIRVLLRENHP